MLFPPSVAPSIAHLAGAVGYGHATPSQPPTRTVGPMVNPLAHVTSTHLVPAGAAVESAAHPAQIAPWEVRPSVQLFPLSWMCSPWTVTASHSQ